MIWNFLLLTFFRITANLRGTRFIRNISTTLYMVRERFDERMLLLVVLQNQQWSLLSKLSMMSAMDLRTSSLYSHQLLHWQIRSLKIYEMKYLQTIYFVSALILDSQRKKLVNQSFWLLGIMVELILQLLVAGRSFEGYATTKAGRLKLYSMTLNTRKRSIMKNLVVKLKTGSMKTYKNAEIQELQ